MSSIFCNFSEVADLDLLAHFLQAFRQLVDHLHLNVELDGQIRVLMRRIHRPTHEKVNVRGLRAIRDAPSF